MGTLHLTRRGFLVAAGSAACLAVLRPRIARAMAVPLNDFKTTMTTMFWVGEQADAENAYIPNHQSYWDKDWLASFGGVDDPWHRNGHWPAGFAPKENPFYVALPYGEFAEQNQLKAEASDKRHPLVSPRARSPAEEPLGRDPLQWALLLRAMAGCRSVRRGRLRVRVRRRQRAAQHFRRRGRVGSVSSGLASPRHDRQCADRMAFRGSIGGSGRTLDRNRHQVRQ